MIITCNLTESDNRAFRKYMFFRYRKLHWFYAVMLAFFLASIWFSNKPDTPLVEKVAGLVGAVIFFGILVLIVLGVLTLIVRFTGGRFRGSTGPHTFEISEDTFAESNALGRQEVRVAGLRRVAETDTHFFIITNIGTAYVIPKRDLQSFDVLYDLQKRVVGPAA